MLRRCCENTTTKFQRFTRKHMKPLTKIQKWNNFSFTSLLWTHNLWKINLLQSYASMTLKNQKWFYEKMAKMAILKKASSPMLRNDADQVLYTKNSLLKIDTFRHTTDIKHCYMTWATLILTLCTQSYRCRPSLAEAEFHLGAPSHRQYCGPLWKPPHWG